MKQRPTIDYLGSILVLLVVVLVPTFLGALSFGSLPVQDAALTTADASAAALNALDRQLQHKILPPAQALAAAPDWWNAELETIGVQDRSPDDLLAATPAATTPATTTPATMNACDAARLL